MGYPVAYRGRRPSRASSSGGGLPPGWDLPIWGGAIGTAVWAFGDLASQLVPIAPELEQAEPFEIPGYELNLGDGMRRWPNILNGVPGDWTADRICNGISGITVRAGGWLAGVCSPAVLSNAAYNQTAMPAFGSSTATVFTWGVGTFNPVLNRWESVPKFNRWTRTVPGVRAWRVTGGAVPRREDWMRNAAMPWQRPVGAYAPVEEPPAYVSGRAYSVVVDRTTLSPSGSTTRPVPIGRAATVPAPAMTEVKHRGGTKAGAAIIAMLRVMQLGADMRAVVYALWKSLPRQLRGRSRTLPAMIADLTRHGWAIRYEWAALNVLKWLGYRGATGAAIGASSRAARHMAGELGSLGQMGLLTTAGYVRNQDVRLARARRDDRAHIRYGGP